MQSVSQQHIALHARFDSQGQVCQFHAAVLVSKEWDFAAADEGSAAQLCQSSGSRAEVQHWQMQHHQCRLLGNFCKAECQLSSLSVPASTTGMPLCCMQPVPYVMLLLRPSTIPAISIPGSQKHGKKKISKTFRPDLRIRVLLPMSHYITTLH